MRNTADETLATKNFNKLSKQPLTMRYHAFSWKTDLTMGLLEGLSSFIGYALMLAVNNSLSLQNLFADRDFVGYGYECLVFYCDHPGHYRW